jgi:hypothetical protein
MGLVLSCASDNESDSEKNCKSLPFDEATKSSFSTNTDSCKDNQPIKR